MIQIRLCLLATIAALICFECRAQSQNIGCNRSVSRDARAVISKVIAPRVKAAQYTLPDTCPLDVAKDQYGVQEAHKILVRRGVWRCKWDDKIFRGESFIDAHMDSKHRHEVVREGSECLADYCGPLHCDFFKHANRGQLSYLATMPCHSGAMKDHKLQCQELAHDCFPPSGSSASQELHAWMLSTLCEAATCRWHRRKDILSPLRSKDSGKSYLWTVMVIAVVGLLAVLYAVLAVQWAKKAGSGKLGGSGVVGQVLQAMGIAKKRPRKLQ